MPTVAVRYARAGAGVRALCVSELRTSLAALLLSDASGVTGPSRNRSAEQRVQQPSAMRYSCGCVAAWVAVVVMALGERDEVDAVPVRFMCGVCVDNFLHCMMNCQMEDYMTRNYYDK